MVLGKLDRYMQEKNPKLDDLLTPHTTLNSKLINDLNIRLKTKNPGRKQAVKSHTLFVAIFFLIYPPRQGKQKKK